MKNRRFSVAVCIGIVFCAAAVIVSPAQTLTTVYQFCSQSNCTDGAAPEGTLVQGHDGNFYGTTSDVGFSGQGTVYKLTSSGTFTVLHSFSGLSDGGVPRSGLIQASDGNFYGDTEGGGTCGVAYKITASGTQTPVHEFAGGAGDGCEPFGPLVQASDGNFYGTTYLGGGSTVCQYGCGTVFKMTPAGTVTILHVFCTQSGCPDGYNPTAGLVQGSDGNLYGETLFGGPNGYGALFKITTSGTMTTLHSFNNTDGSGPTGGLVQGGDGNFYGTTSLGGANSAGTVFMMTPSGTLTTLHSFCTQSGCPDGSSPNDGLLRASDGNFYGTAVAGGAHASGTVFAITPGGSLTTIYSFCSVGGGSCSDGAYPYAGLIQGSDGKLYGVTTQGGNPNYAGTAFNLTLESIPTTTVLTSTPNPSYQGENVTLTATVTAQNGSTPAGTVVFKSDGTQIGSAALNSSGVAVLNFTALAVGSDSLTAVYQGLPPLEPSTSNTVTQVVHPGSTTTVTSTPNPSAPGQNVTITATVGPAGPPTPTGTVGFASNGTEISGCGAVTVTSARMAVCPTSSLPVGTDTIVATYSGDGNYGPSSGTDIQIVNPIPVAWQFVTLPPCRVVDTRNANGTFGGPPIPGNTARAFPLGQSGNPCNIPSTAVAYSLNVTAVPITTLSYLTIWPSGEGQPVVSTLNSLDGRIKANAVIIPAGTSSGSVSVFVTNTTNVVLDINGYFIPSSGSTLAFYPVTPCRVVDTRNPNGPLGGPYLTHGQERDFPLLESTCIPAGATSRPTR